MAVVVAAAIPSIVKKVSHIFAVKPQAQYINSMKRQQEYPIETQHVLLNEAKRRKIVMPNDVVSILDSALIANAIIKDAHAERKLKALAIARRLHYCLSS